MVQTPEQTAISPNPANKIENEKHRRITETLLALNAAVDPGKLTLLSNKPLEEVGRLQQEIADVIPVGNIAGLVLSGLTRLKGRTVPRDQARRDVIALMRGLDVIPKALYGAFFVSPATVLFAYQKMLTLAGKDADSAFPDGLWQFYVEFSMREDIARHINETNGFLKTLAAHNLNLPLPDQLTAWALTISRFLFQYEDLLLTEWQERTTLKLLMEAAQDAAPNQNDGFDDLDKKWLQQKPYQRGNDAQIHETYPQYRRRKFERFCKPYKNQLPASRQRRLTEAYENNIPAFQQQMSILSTLDPERYKETRQPLPLWQTRLAIVWQNQYHILPVCALDAQGNPLCFEQDNPKEMPVALSVNEQGQLIHPNRGVVITYQNGLVAAEMDDKPIGFLKPLSEHQLRNWIWTICNERYPASNIASFDASLLQIPRPEQRKARKKLSTEDAAGLELLKLVPVIINWDEQDQNQSLAEIRLGRRGVGDHALTVFRTQDTIVFDQSHILFDGAWGLAVSEILTNEAISWGAYLAQLPPLTAPGNNCVSQEPGKITVSAESSAETKRARLSQMRRLRQNLHERHNGIIFTINDLLILARTLYNRRYRPGQTLQQQVTALAQTQPQVANQIQEAWYNLPTVNPVLLIPIDATGVSPRDRLYPVTFRNPFPALLDLVEDTYSALLIHTATKNTSSWTEFNNMRAKLIDEIYHFGQLMLAYKKLTLEGHTPSIATLKLLGHLPGSMQKLLDQLPQHFDVLNEVLKGEEVFSNAGRVVPGSSITRFTSARDDNDAKTLVWGFITDDRDRLHISLRDFRPETMALLRIKQTALAHALSKDFLTGFAIFLNVLVDKLNQIVTATA